MYVRYRTYIYLGPIKVARCHGLGLVAVIGRHTVSPALPLEVETSPGEITKVAVLYFCLQDLHTVVQLLHSSGQVILVNALERSRFRLHLLLCGSTRLVEDIKYKIQVATR